MALSVSPTITIPAQHGAALHLPAGAVLEIVAIANAQVADLALFDAENPRDSFSPGRTIDYNERIRLHIGDALYSANSEVLARVVGDTVGVHDILLSPCSRRMFERRGEFEHRSCHGSLCEALEPYGIAPEDVRATVNVFMDVRVDDRGNVRLFPPPVRAGDRFAIQAERSLLVGITACSSELTNAGTCKAVAYRLR